MARRHDDLFGAIANFQALLAAARRAVKGKRRKPGAAAFMANLERELLRLERELGPDFLRLANALSALYPMASEEKRLLDAMLLAMPR